MTAAPTPPWIPTDTFGRRLLWLRHELKLTQRQAAEKCGLDDGSWSNWEAGASPRNMSEVVHRIHDAFRVDKAWLMWGTQPVSPTPDGEGSTIEATEEVAYEQVSGPVLAIAA